MIHTIRIDDSTTKGKRLIKALQKETEVVQFENPALTGITPEGYLTEEEFVKETDEIIINQFKKHGLL